MKTGDIVRAIIPPEPPHGSIVLACGFAFQSYGDYWKGTNGMELKWTDLTVKFDVTILYMSEKVEK